MQLGLTDGGVLVISSWVTIMRHDGGEFGAVENAMGRRVAEGS